MPDILSPGWPIRQIGWPCAPGGAAALPLLPCAASCHTSSTSTAHGYGQPSRRRGVWPGLPRKPRVGTCAAPDACGGRCRHDSACGACSPGRRKREVLGRRRSRRARSRAWTRFSATPAPWAARCASNSCPPTDSPHTSRPLLAAFGRPFLCSGPGDVCARNPASRFVSAWETNRRTPPVRVKAAETLGQKRAGSFTLPAQNPISATSVDHLQAFRF